MRKHGRYEGALKAFRPGIIGGNANMPGYVAWLGRPIPGRHGTIEQDDIGRAFAAEFISSSAPAASYLSKMQR